MTMMIHRDYRRTHLHLIIVLACLWLRQNRHDPPLIGVAAVDPHQNDDASAAEKTRHNGENHAANLFTPPPEIQVWGPSEFPKPTDKLLQDQYRRPNAIPVVHVEPTHGSHRPDHDAILAYAEGYKLPWYQMFMNTLAESGYRGDVVLAIAEERIVSEHVVDFLKTFTVGDPDKPNLVVYQQALDCDNNSPDNKEYYGTNKRQLTKHGDTNPFQMCRLPHVYGWKQLNDDTVPVETVPDPRSGRVVATLRFEWYWIWAQKYNPHSWLMLLDARDSFFQSDPFADLPRTPTSQPKTRGLLYLFGENAEATRLGISKKNQQWIRRAYGDATIDVLKDKPTICSGSTMGEQVAMETYIRAMVNEHDECDVVMMGSDQGFHNFLYYSQKMIQASAIERIVVWEQGRGQINNLGALRTKPLKEWGKLYNPETHQVFQWPADDDDETEELILSPVVHQWDRDKDLHSWMTRTKHKAWEKEWTNRHKE